MMSTLGVSVSLSGLLHKFLDRGVDLFGLVLVDVVRTPLGEYEFAA